MAGLHPEAMYCPVVPAMVCGRGLRPKQMAGCTRRRRGNVKGFFDKGRGFALWKELPAGCGGGPDGPRTIHSFENMILRALYLDPNGIARFQIFFPA